MRLTPTTALAILLLPALVSGQEPVKSFDQLNTRLKIGDKIIITDAQGREHEGKILEMSPSALTLRGHGGQQMNMSSDVRLVQDRPRDSLKNGALIGLACGLALGAVSAADCARGYCEFSPAFIFAVAGGVFGAAGSGIGIGIDALIPGKKRVIYRAPQGEPTARMTLTPIITPRAKGVAVSVGF